MRTVEAHGARTAARDERAQSGQAPTERPPRWFGPGLLALAGLLVLNTVLGPLVLSAITYPFSETVQNETIGLEAVSVFLVAPLAAVAGVLVLRGSAVGAVLAMGPAGYTAYMFVQYVAGPGYLTYQPSLVLHVAIFALAAAILLQAWVSARPATQDWGPSKRHRRWAAVLVALAAFVISRWAEALNQMIDDAPLEEAYVADAGMYWTIYLLDLGIIVPATLFTAVALYRHRMWAPTALFGLVGWFALVPPSVLAMAVAKVVNDDPFADPADTIVLGIATLAFAAVAVALYRTLPGTDRTNGDRPRSG